MAHPLSMTESENRSAVAASSALASSAPGKNVSAPRRFKSPGDPAKGEGASPCGWWRCFRRPDFGHFASSAMPPAMQAHAKPIRNQCMRVRERSAATEVGTARLAVEVGMGRSVCSSALRRSTNERISHFSPRLLLLHRTACSLLSRSVDLSVGLIQALRAPRVPDLPTAVIVGVHLFEAAGTRPDASKNVARGISVQDAIILTLVSHGLISFLPPTA